MCTYIYLNAMAHFASMVLWYMRLPTVAW
jgi:hypothetical protein